jgi:transposase-like protein
MWYCPKCGNYHDTTVCPQILEAPMQQGWICPKCGRVYGPNCYECWWCNNNKGATP